MMSKEEKMKAVAEFIESELKCKYRHMSLVLDETKLLKQALEENNKFASKESLSCRAKHLEEVKGCDRRILQKVDEMGVISVFRANLLLRNQIAESGLAEQDEFKDCIVLTGGIRSVWERIVEVDKLMSQRVVGKQSYYE